MNKDQKTKKISGIVERVRTDAKAHTGDLSFSADYTVTSTTDGGGLVLTNVEVILCFWGSFWSANPAPSPSRDEYQQAIEGIITGPYNSGLNQYRGVAQGTLIYSEINDATDPADLYTDSDVVNMLTDRIKNHGMPAPTTGHNRFYAVIAPKGIRNSITKFAGQHQSFSVDGVKAYYAWVDNTGSLTGHDCTTKVFSHEFTEACTNPDVDSSNNGILVNGTKSDGTSVSNDEIGDTCNNEFATITINGITCSVQSYWSKADNACILPLGALSFWVDKNTYGKDEVQDAIDTNGGVFSNAFWLVLEQFSITTFNSFGVTIPVPTGSFANLAGVSILPSPATPGGPTPAQPIPEFENPGNPDAIQRIRFSFDIKFTTAATPPFPTSGHQEYGLSAVFNINGTAVPGINSQAAANFELTAGEDPYFTNINPSENNVFYLSEDLRVFTVTPGVNSAPVGNVGTPPQLNVANTMLLDPNAGFQYAQDLINYLNANYNDPNGTDPFTLLPDQAGAFNNDSSVTPFTFDFSSFPIPKIYSNYNYSIARVRLKGTHLSQAPNVKVFFRLWSTQTSDTDYQPATTYLSTLDSSGLPSTPLIGPGKSTIPFFATGNFPGSNDYISGGVNNRTISINTGDSTWAYFGCFLNIYDGGNIIDGQQIQHWLNGTHHCIVAQIAYDDAPIINANGVTMSPENSDKLAQRNLQVTHSDNPGAPDTHRIPQTFDIRPSQPLLQLTGSLLNYPDELMIDWGNTPEGSTANIFWPQVNASQVIQLASSIYPSHLLKATDANTIQCKVIKGVTYVPIPVSAGENFAGLFTVDLPPTVVKGQEFNIVVRRITTRRNQDQFINRKEFNNEAVVTRLRNWRYVTGTFQVKIPVSTKEVLLFPEENTLAILKWRIEGMLPSNRWYRVMQRYISYIAARVDGLGGNSISILPSPQGVPPTGKGKGHGKEKPSYTGKVCEIIYDCFGDFEGFVLHTCDDKHHFKCREKGINELVLKACRDRLLLSVFVLEKDCDKITRIVVHC
jgi:hypothetical protein